MIFSPSMGRRIEIGLVLAVIAAVSISRIERLDLNAFWVDEAESAINALTILDNGLPVDRYLGLPIYENTLVKPWPGNPEYEFKDSSYSDRGVATYHAWLPLYAMAASFALHHIQPDRVQDGGHLGRSLDELKRRSRAGRLPSVVFNAIFLFLCYYGGTLLMGRDAGIAALLVGSLYESQVWISGTARYYSATVALSMAAVCCLWLILTRGDRKSHVLTACVLTLLFYTHLITFFTGVAVWCAVAVVLLVKNRSAFRDLALSAALVGIGTVPWIFGTGWLSGLGAVPPGRSLLLIPADLLTFRPAGISRCVAFAAFAAAVVWSWRKNPELTRPIWISIRESRPAFTLLTLWIASGYVAFILFMPAASFFQGRINLSYRGPAILLGSVFCAVICRTVLRRYSLILTPMLAVALASSADMSGILKAKPSEGYSRVTAMQSYLMHAPLQPGTKLYASPNEHLVLTFYTGLPFQSIAPIRKQFLDSYPGEVLFAELAAFLPQSHLLNPAKLQEAARSEHASLAESEAVHLTRMLRTYSFRASLNRDVFGIACQPNVPGYAFTALKDAWMIDPFFEVSQGPQPPLFHGFQIHGGRDWREIFLYRFVDPMSRIGPRANYVDRLRGATADLLTEGGWAIYRSPASRPSKLRGVEYRFLP